LPNTSDNDSDSNKNNSRIGLTFEPMMVDER